MTDFDSALLSQASSVHPRDTSRDPRVLHMVPGVPASERRLHVLLCMLRASQQVGAGLRRLGVPATAVQPMRVHTPGTAAVF